MNNPEKEPNEPQTTLDVKDLKGLLEASYDKGINETSGYVKDKKLSKGKTKVFVNAEGKTVVAHRGTDGMKDWGNNLAYAVGGKDLYKTTDRFKDAKKVQREAEKKYGRDNITTIGHSQGGLQAELLGKKGNDIITYNKATRPFSNHQSKNQTDIRTSNDLISALNPFQNRTSGSVPSSRQITIKSKGFNPLKEHSLQRLR
jgi:hypothetical protein